jgi:hypothetical protein
MTGIHQAMTNVMRKVVAIGKDQKNVQQNFNFRGIDQVYNGLHTLMAEEGIITVPRQMGEVIRQERVTKSGGLVAFTVIQMCYEFYHQDGSHLTVGPVIGEGMDSGDKGSNKAMSVAHKYALLQTFMIPTQEMDDPDRDSWELGAGKPPATDAWGDETFKDEWGDETFKDEWSGSPAGDVWGDEPTPQPVPRQPHQPQPQPRGPSAEIDGQVIYIEDDASAADVTDFIIRMAYNMHGGSMESLTGFWHQNKQVIDCLDEHFPHDYARLKQAFTEVRNQLENMS